MMSIVINQQSLKSFFETKLQSNSYDVEFDVDLFNSDYVNYWDYDDLGQKYRVVPTIITDVIGEYLNVPNSNSTSSTVGIQFDIFVGHNNDNTTNVDETEFSKVGYTDTLNAIEEFKNTLQAQYFPLGTPYLYMGGEDSTATFSFSGNISVDFIYIKFVPFNTDEETIFSSDGSTKVKLHKDDTDIIFEIGTSLSLSVPYSVNDDITLTIYRSDSGWTMTDGTNTDTDSDTTFLARDEFYLGETTGFEGLIKTLVVDAGTGQDEYDELEDYQIEFVTFPSKDAFTNSGIKTLTTNTINNSILWSEDGNAIFGISTLNPITDPRTLDGGVMYQAFELEITTFVSNDVLFGNNFEYYLDGIQVYPIDREHTFGTEMSGAQYINGNDNEFIVTESAREHTMSFYYIPSKKLNSILKHVLTGDTAQNTTYTLLVQYPFFQKSYSVVVDSGGINPNINTLASFTVVFKKADSNL